MLLLTTLLVIGIRESARFNNIIVIVKVAIVLAVIGFGIRYINTANWSPFIPQNTGEFGHFGWSGILRGAGVIFFAYIGFDAVSTAAQEAKNPQRDLPIGILGSLVVCTILYILMAAVMTGIAHYTELNVPHPVFVAIEKAGPALKWLGFLVNIGAIAGLFPIGLLGELVSIGTLLAFVIVCAGIIVLRYAQPDLPRPFRTPFVPLVPLLGIAICGYMMYGLPLDTWLRLLIWMALGLAIYFLYGMRHSALAKRDAS